MGSSAKTRSTMGCAIVDFPVLAGPESGDFSKSLQASSDSCSDSGPVSTVTTIQDDRIGFGGLWTRFGSCEARQA